MNVIDMNIEDLIPYENNPRYNDDAVETVKKALNSLASNNLLLLIKIM